MRVVTACVCNSYFPDIALRVDLRVIDNENKGISCESCCTNAVSLFASFVYEFVNLAIFCDAYRVVCSTCIVM